MGGRLPQPLQRPLRRRLERIDITWADGSIKNQWLQITIKATVNSGLASADVFYFGNQVGDLNSSGLVDLADFNTLAAHRGRRCA